MCSVHVHTYTSSAKLSLIAEFQSYVIIKNLEFNELLIESAYILVVDKCKTSKVCNKMKISLLFYVFRAEITFAFSM